MDDEKQIISVFMDDSGVFTKGCDDFFVYAGYVFVGNDDKDEAKRRYRSLSDNIRKNIGHTGELKAKHLRGTKHKRALVKVLEGYESLTCVITLTSIKQSIMESKLSIHRYKDYAIKITIKRKLETLINAGHIDPGKVTELNIYIDEQHTSTDGFYNLAESIREEFVNGIRNLDYGSFHPPLFNNSVVIRVQFCDSSSNYLIQASDILANRMNTSFNYHLPALRQLPRLNIVRLP